MNFDEIIKEDMENIFQRDSWKCFDGTTFLITGAYGMLASYLVSFLIFLNEYKSFNIRIILVGRSSTKIKRCFGEYLDREYITICLSDTLDIQKLPDCDVDYYVHAAGIANPRLYATMPVNVAEPNVIGTYNLLKISAQHKTKKFLFFSSGDIYGKIDSQIITEDMSGAVDPLGVHSCYGESKRMGENLCFDFFKQYNVPTVIARIGHTYGPNMDLDNDPRVFASFMKCAIERKDIELLSDGRAKRPFCYVADAIAAYLLLLKEGKPGEAYNVCNTNQFLSIYELAKIIAKLSPIPLQVTFKNRDLNDKYVENTDNMCNCPVEDKLKKLGWNCEYTAEQGFMNVYSHLMNSGIVHE